MSRSSEVKEGSPQKASSVLRHINLESLFNLPLYEHHLVIDTRSADDYDKGHVVSAVSYPSPVCECSDLEREKTLIKFIKSYVKEYFRPENPSPIVVYGDSTPHCTTHINWLAGKLELLQKDRKVLARVDKDQFTERVEQEYRDDDEDKPFDYFQHFCHTIADRAKEIWILDDGYDAFKKEYPFLCGHVDWSSMFPLPHQVDRNLFLGTRVFPLEKDCLKKLGITHVIVSEFQKINWRELDGISVLRCSVKDENDQAMLPCWKACYQFITEALAGTPTVEQCSTNSQNSTDMTAIDDAESDLPNMTALKISVEDKSPVSLVTTPGSCVTSDATLTNNGVESTEGANGSLDFTSEQVVRILVLLHGRSRSSSVILAYLIKSQRMSFGEAWTYLCSKCWHIIDRSLVYVDQLKHWEQTELSSIEEF